MKKGTVKKRILSFAAALIMTLSLFTQALPTTASAISGSFANLVVMVRFKDDTEDIFAANWTAGARIRDMYEKTDGSETASLKRYLSIMSDGRLTVNNVFPQEVSDAVTSLTLPKTQGEYTQDTQIIADAVALLNDSGLTIGDAVLDNRDAGYLDNLTVLVQGSTSDSGSIIYPHKGNYGGGLTAFGKAVTTYNIINSGALIDNLMHQGVICHEFMHSLGLPDLYRYNSSGVPVGSWDLMGGGVSIYLQYLLSYSRQQLGWLSMDTIDTARSDPDATYTLDWVGAAGGRRGYIIRSPLSSSEFFVVEYRRAFEQSAENIQNPPIDFKAPGTGLVIYRVNPNVTGQTNAAGENYIYIFRPNVTDADNDTNALTAAVDPSAVTSYGSTDLTAAFTANTLYYSGSRHLNSGIQLNNITANSDNTISFKVSFADYTSEDLWDAVGGGVASDAFSASCAVDGSGAVYAAYDVNHTTSVKKYASGAWTGVGGAVSIYDPQLLYQGGALYMLGSDTAGTVKCMRLDSGGWTEVYSKSFPGATKVRFVNASDGLYACFHIGNTLYIVDLASPTAAPICQSTPPLANSMDNISVCLMGDSFYASYLDYLTADTCRVARLTGSGWQDMNLPANNMKFSEIATDGTNLLLAAGCDGQTPKFYTYNGSAWSTEDITVLANNADIDLVMAGSTVYVGGISSDTDRVAKAYQRGSGGWTQVGGNIASGISGLSLCHSGGKLYAATVDMGSGSAVNVRSKDAESTPVTPPITPPTTPDYTVSVTPPSGYSDTVLWIDGVAYPASSSGGRLSAVLGDGSAKIVTMYKYNASGIPTGMYVWSLSFANNVYTATAIPALQDLLSYHGFSIRVAGVPGIRFKSGISSSLRGTLLSPSGAGGYRLVNYGTLFTNNSYLASFPFVHGAEHIGSGFAYWTENGAVNDRIFETAQGRYRFTSVITGVPDTAFNVQFAFRSFITLTKGGEQVKVYGPVVSRSIVTVANQVLSAGEFASGSAGDLYVRNIVAAAARNP